MTYQTVIKGAMVGAAIAGVAFIAMHPSAKGIRDKIVDLLNGIISKQGPEIVSKVAEKVVR